MAEFIRASVSQIHVGERARPVDEDHAQAIAASMGERGQINPITLRRTPAANRGRTPLTLVAGGHRLRAAHILGWSEIDAIVVGVDQVEAQLIEISENLYRNELSALDRAVFVMTYRELWEEKHGKVQHGGDRRSKGHDDPLIFASGRELSQSVQDRFGFGQNTYKRTIRIARNLHPMLRASLRGTGAEYDQSKLLKLAKLPADTQVKVAAALSQDPDVDRALSWTKAPKAEINEQDANLAKLKALWAKTDGDTQRKFLAHIGETADFSFLEAAE
ncbi:ParB N-terminal domain-containing protein [Sinorhizobium medicae]|uniref:ParB N-terminal domain-containing protein n=1 Tax=Sinorhizobium medicae TaxID=110321 RepID=UPI0003F56F33|nr:ParB N-terminal domain-containing protein [Sinorhizobium medicae]RVQ76145.1 transcriptional regulator [Sinorhizobium medicae]